MGGLQATAPPHSFQVAELKALTMVMMSLPTDAACFIVTDSTAALGKFLHVRDHMYHSPRWKTGRVIGGISKSLTVQLEKEIEKSMTSTTDNARTPTL
jgi:hypothetical protein